MNSKSAFAKSFLEVVAGVMMMFPYAVTFADTRLDDSGRSPDYEVVISATRGSEQDPLNIAQSTESIQNSELMSQGYADVDEAVRKTANVSLAPAEGNPNYWQEGFSVRGLGAQRVLTLTDGVRQAGQGIGYGGGNLSLYDIFSIERIEILKGPASVLYGTDAFGGVVNVITRNPSTRDEFGHNGGAGYLYDGSRDQNRAGAYIDFGDATYGTVLGGSYTDSDVPDLPDDVEATQGSYRNFSLFGKSDFHFTEDSKLRLIANINRTKDILVEDTIMPLPIAMFPPPGATETITSPLFFEFPLYERSLLGAEYTLDNLGDGWTSFKAGLYWQQLRREFHRETAYYALGFPGFAGPPSFVLPAATINTAVVDTDDDVDTYEFHTQATKAASDHSLVFGFDAGIDNSYFSETHTDTVVGRAGVGATSGIPTVENRIRADADQLRLGVYTQDTWNLDPFDVIPGIRADYFSVEDAKTDFDDDEIGVSGSLSTVYHEDKNTSYYGTIASGFRAPDLGERFQDAVVNLGAPTRLIGTANLDTERSYSAEIGSKRRNNKVQFEYAAYVSNIENYIGRENVGAVHGVTTEMYSNLGDVLLYGTEAGGEYKVDEMWSVFANVGRTWTDDKDLVRTPNWIFNYGVACLLPAATEVTKDIRTGLNVRSVLKSKDFTNAGIASSGERFDGSSYTTLDFFLNVALVETNFGSGTIISGVKNLLDRKYKEPFFNEYQPARSVYVGLNFDF